MAAPSDLVQRAFETSIRDFKAKLKDDELYSEILQTTSINQVYDMTDKLQEEQAKNGHMRHLSKIGPFLERLGGYAGTIETFTQAKPEILALIWGPIKLLLQWTSVLKRSFDELIKTIADIGNLLPEFERVIELFSYNMFIKDVLAMFFQDILDIYVIALKFFSLTRWKLIFEMMWPKQRDKIQLVMSHIERHTLLMRNEVRLENIREEHEARLKAMNHYETTERSHRRQEYNGIKEVLSPRMYEEELDRILGRICEGTGKWIFRDATFNKWLKGTEKPAKLIWLQGIPGAGKTYLSGTIVEQALTLGRTLFVFLSYNFTSSISALSILHSLVFQLTSDDDDLQAILCQSVAKELKRDWKKAMGLLATLLGTAGSVFIVIDGLDEIDEIERTRLLRGLLELSNTCHEAKFLVSSRIEDDIHKVLHDKAVEVRIDSRNAGSIQAFVEHRAQDWFMSREFLPEDRTEIMGLLAPLSSKANGMFLYAKVVLSSIEELDGMKAIRDELEVLPDNLDDAYKKIFSRINRLNPSSLRDKARKLLGWIGSSPTPLKVHEIEQALIVKMDDLDGSVRVIARLNPVRICGPILEVVDGYVQFVHFTAKEYIFSQRNDDNLDIVDATLNLMRCCVHYLCQRHHDIDLPENEFRNNIFLGLYRLTEYSATNWLELLKRYLNLTKSIAPPSDLISLFRVFVEKRSNDAFIVDTALSPTQRLGLRVFQTDSPDIYEMLCNAIYFQEKCFEGEFDKRKTKETSWISLDPLTITQTSIRLFNEFDQLLCGSGNAHIKDCYCSRILWHFSERPFTCSFLGCSLSRYGFSTKSARNSHQKHHDRPWKCSRSDCPYSEGFLSRRMRDQHWEQCHQERQKTNWLQQRPDDDELQPLLFDLVRADKVDLFRNLLPQFVKCNHEVKFALLILAAGSGSTAMVGLIEPVIGTFGDKICIDVIKASITGENMETLMYFLRVFKNIMLDGMSWLFLGVLNAKSEEIRLNWETYLNIDIDLFKEATSREKQKIPLANRYTKRYLLRAVTGTSDNETLLLLLWQKLDLAYVMSQTYLGEALKDVAATCCSVKLAKYLVDAGAAVDYRRNAIHLTPLHHAVTHNTAEAAELVKFLLIRGANPAAFSTITRWHPITRGHPSSHKIKRISDEVGAKNISKWLGMSWDDLVAETATEKAGTEAGNTKKENA